MVAAAAQALIPHVVTGAAPGSGAVGDELLLPDRSVRIRVLREDGTPWPIYQRDGHVHRQGAAGARYVIEVAKLSPTQDIEIILVIDGATKSGGRPHKDWVSGFALQARPEWRLEGFRKTKDHVAAFRFSDAADSVVITRGSGSASAAGKIRIKLYKVAAGR